ncbi:hypothetical protein [Bacillus atrophaeus]|uniref:hypothetical protein n=1 Tax=Bacillus atrophaeus TaxID=1452 RepID=UPI002E1A0BFB|nr:hypothetical protein [Bacillus atrophaeus]
MMPRFFWGLALLNWNIGFEMLPVGGMWFIKRTFLPLILLIRVGEVSHASK